MSKKLTEKTLDDLLKEVANLRKEVRERRFDVAGAKAKDVKEHRKLRRDVARLLTEIRKRHTNDRVA